MTHGSTPPGWYDDGQGGQRWWDGQQWAPPGAGPGQPGSGQPGQQSGQPGQQPRSKGPLWAGLAVLVVAVIVFAVTAFVAPGFLVGDDDERADDPATDDPTTSQTTTDEPTASTPTESDPTESTEPLEPTEPTVPTEPDLGDPADVVQAFYDAALVGDCDVAGELVSERFLDEEGGCDPDDFDPGDVEGLEFTVGEAEIEGDTAVVLLTISQDGVDIGASALLVAEDDGWKIDAFGDEFGEPYAEPSASGAPEPTSSPTG